MKNILIIYFALSLFSCKQNVQEETIYQEKEELAQVQEIDTAMLGTWNSNVLDIVLDFSTDSAKKILVLKEEFPEKLGISQVEAIYRADGSFSSSYFAIDGSIYQTEEGTWYALGDSLIIEYDSEGVKNTFVYHYEVLEAYGIFTTLMDWDQDGKKDDRLILKSLIERN